MTAAKEAPKAKAKSRKLDWWEPQTPVVGYSPTTQMLVNYVAKGEKTLHVGRLHGFLLDVEEGSRKDLIDDIIEITGGSMLFSAESLKSSGPWEATLVWPDGSVTFRHYPTNMVDVEISTTNKRTYSRLVKACSNVVVKAQTRSPVYSLAKDASGLMFLIEIGNAGAPFEGRNYEPEVRMAYHFTKKELSSPNPSGRLTLVHGSPGSGKTYFIRGLLAEVENARFVLVPSNLVEDLGGPTLIPALVKAREDMDPHEALVLIIEDSDRCLGSRDTAMNAISSILNASSGILGSSLNLRVICTTNATYEKLDPALSRTGRLSMEVLVGELSSERASKIYTRLAGGSDFVMPEGSTLSQVYEYVRKNEEIDDEDEEYEDLDD